MTMNDMMTHTGIIAILLIVAVSGCVGAQKDYRCPDGSMAASIDACPAEQKNTANATQHENITQESICPQNSDCPDCLENDSCEPWAKCVNRTTSRGCYAQCSGVYLETRNCTEDELQFPDCLQFDDVSIDSYGNMGYHQATGIIENTCDKYFDYVPVMIVLRLYDGNRPAGETEFASFYFEGDNAVYSYEANERRPFSGLIKPEGDYTRFELEMIDDTYGTDCHILYSEDV